MAEKWVMPGNYSQALNKARAEFAGRSPRLMAEKSGAVYSAALGYLSLNYCGSPYHISHPGGEVRGPAGEEVAGSEATLLLLYLVESGGPPPSGRWISFAELPNGSHHLAPFLKEAVYPLALTFGADPGRLREAAKPLGGQPLLMGDCGQFIPALPNSPVAAAVWAGDGEFPARATILFDALAPLCLDTAFLYVLGLHVSLKLRAAAGS